MKKPIRLFVLLLALSLAACKTTPKDTTVYFIDTHNDILVNQYEQGYLRPVTLPGWSDHFEEQIYFDLEDAAQGRLVGQMFSVFVDDTPQQGNYFKTAMRQIDSIEAFVSRNSQKAMMCRSYEDLMKAREQGKFAAMIGVEGGHFIEDSMDYLDSLTKRGMRYMTLTWNNSTPWATSAQDEDEKKDSLPFLGLTEKGKQIVHRMNELGVMVDVSHVGEETFYDVMETTTKPVIASHSNAYALTPTPRNLKDAQLQAIKENGGVVFVNFYSGYLDSTFYKREEGLWERFQKEYDSLLVIHKDPFWADIAVVSNHLEAYDSIRPPLGTLIDHIDYIVQKIGVDHVGLGSDFDGANSFPKGLNTLRDFPKIEAALRERGYSTEDLQKIGSGNFYRVFEEVQKAR